MESRFHILKRLMIAVFICVLTVLACIYLYHYDNKYTASGPQGRDGILWLNADDLKEKVILVRGWAIYGGVLLTPEDFEIDATLPDKHIFIGQYAGFEELKGGTPHGSATYRLLIGIPDKTNSYMLALPEVFSSCRVYVNGKEKLALGEIDPTNYRFETGNAIITFDAAGVIDLVIAVSDFKHLYSGMVYPPILGESSVVSELLFTRLVLRAAVLAIALMIGIIALIIGILRGQKMLATLYGLLCFLFVGYVCYPLVMTFTRGSPLIYAIENISFCAMLLFVIALLDKLTNFTVPLAKWGRYLRWFMYGLGIFVCLTAAMMPFLLPRAGLSLMMGYSHLIMAYHWVMAGYITVMAGFKIWKKDSNVTPLFWGMLVLDATLVMDRVLHKFEPMVSGWFPEWGAFVLVLSIGAAVMGDIIRRYRENMVLEEQVRMIITYGSDHYRKMEELYEKLHILRHDYKYHLTVLGELLNSDDKGEIENYLSGVQIQLAESAMKTYCHNSAVNALLSGFSERFLKAGIKFEVMISLPKVPVIPDYELCIVLGNLLENAMEACAKKSGDLWVEVRFKPLGTQLILMVRNSYGGSLTERSGRPVSTKKKGGLGLRSIEAVVEKYDGELVTEWGEGVFEAYVMVRL